MRGRTLGLRITANHTANYSGIGSQGSVESPDENDFRTNRPYPLSKNPRRRTQIGKRYVDSIKGLSELGPF